MLHKRQYNNKPKPLHTFIKVNNNDSNNNNSLSLRDKGTYFYKQWFSGKKNKDGMKKMKSSSLNPSSSFFSYSIPIACSIALLGGLGMMISPVCGSGGLLSTSGSVYAEGSDGSDSGSDYGISAQADDTLSLTLGNTVSTNADLGGSTIVEAGVVNTRNYTFTAVSKTNGYKVFIQAASGYTGNLRGLANPREEITGVGTNVAANSTDFKDNTWGYSLKPSTDSSTPTYSTVPESSNVYKAAYISKTPTNGTEFDLSFAAKIGSDKPADHYQTKVLLSLAARPSTIVTLSDITTMQQMTPDICADTPTEPATGYTARLTDIRDNKQYWVAKLKDNNCWMTQNLDFDGGGIRTPPTNWETDSGVARFFDPEDYVYSTPTTITNCGSVTSLADCTSKGWTKVGTGTSYPTAGTNSNMASVLSGSTYDAHYLVGNYYSWPAATVGSGKDLWEDGSEAPGSICPKGWSLPLAGDSTGSNNNKSGSFYNLLSKYGFSFGDNDISDSAVSTTGQNIATAPLYLSRNGFIRDKTIAFPGTYAYYWSSVIVSNSTIYYLYFDGNSVNAKSMMPLSLGLVVRCVATSS